MYRYQRINILLIGDTQMIETALHQLLLNKN
jgi:hypothetical protein